jgi:non-haem Fe2+, alpha-ketoglutarate-dependent halogenase
MSVDTTDTLLDRDAEFFFSNGFVGPFKLYKPDEARKILKEIRIKSFDTTKALFNNDVNYDRHFDISELSRHIVHPGIVGRIQKLMGPDILCWRTEFFPKFPSSKGTEWHQVEVYQYSTGTAQLAPTVWHENIPTGLGVWTALTESTLENGCLKFMPGSHKQQYYDETKMPKAGRDSLYKSVASETSFFGYNYEDFKVDPDWEPDESKAVALEMEPGECVIFTEKCMHASFPNSTKNSTRFAITSRYVRTDVRVYPDLSDFSEHGGYFDLTHYGCVLASGNNRFNHNKIRRENNLGELFPEPL